LIKRLFLYVLKKNTLSKNERLKSRKQIEFLFGKGKSFSVGSIKVYHALFANEQKPETSSLQFGVAVGTRHFKKAVHRNRVKRLMREAYRLQKHNLQQQLEDQSIQLNVFFVFTGKELPGYDLIFEKTGTALKKLMKEYA
jgi:ribonuclease P protein component